MKYKVAKPFPGDVIDAIKAHVRVLRHEWDNHVNYPISTETTSDIVRLLAAE
jgi:hypothetical protein